MANVIERCHACGQSTQRWDRKLNKSMAEVAELMYYHGKHKWHHTPTIHPSHEGSQLRWWGLTRGKPGTRKDGGAGGYYRLTRLGIQFVEGLATVPQQCLGPKFDEGPELYGPEVNIDDCLGENFDLQELIDRVTK